uniref:Lipocalin n=1 Tax=Rhipicephalus appendiculatus TaxID=34631 RepID=A0A131Z7L3_RHIAP
MTVLTKRAFARTAACLLVLGYAHCEGKHQLDNSVIDAFKVFQNIPYATTIYDIDGDGDLDCVTAVRTEFSENPQETTYALLLKGPTGNQTRNMMYHIKPGPTPDTTHFTVDDDNDLVLEAQLYYTDYRNCVVMGYPFEGIPECLLWTTKNHSADVPQYCMLEYKKFCKDAGMPFDEESCAQFIG